MINLQEREKKVPVKFYKDSYGTIYYESSFTNGTAPSLNDAFSEFNDKDFKKEILMFLDDVVGVRIGRFIPSLTDRKYKGMTYIGYLEVFMETEDIFKNSLHSLNYLSKNKNYIPTHKKWIKDMKKKGMINELFDPEKTNNDLICEHCGNIIPKGHYYELYRSNAYHIECLWDKLINKNNNNLYSNCVQFFNSLKKYIGMWPVYGYDTEEDYLYDLSLIEHNNRIHEVYKLNTQLSKVIED